MLMHLMVTNDDDWLFHAHKCHPDIEHAEKYKRYTAL